MHANRQGGRYDKNKNKSRKGGRYDKNLKIRKMAKHTEDRGSTTEEEAHDCPVCIEQVLDEGVDLVWSRADPGFFI